MNRFLNQVIALLLLVLTLSTTLVIPQAADARTRYYRAPVTYVRTYNRRLGIYQSHPIISRTVTGAALGAVTGAVVGAISGRRRIGRGALIGAGAGAVGGLGYGLFRNRQYTGRWF